MSIAEEAAPIFRRESELRELARLMTKYPECAICHDRLPSNTGTVKCLHCGTVTECS